MDPIHLQTNFLFLDKTTVLSYLLNISELKVYQNFDKSFHTLQKFDGSSKNIKLLSAIKI